MRNLFTEFRQFILRGNVVDLAVGIVIGVAFTGVVQGLVRDFVNPLIAVVLGAALVGEPIGARTVLAAAMIIAAVAGVIWGTARN